MPQKRNSEAPLPPMTWRRARPVLIACVLLDVLGFMCQNLWIFGPALAGLICTGVASSYVGGTIGGVLCGSGAAVLGVAGASIIAPAGIVMAMMVALFGWLSVGLWLVMKNKQIFAANAGNALWYAVGLVVEEVPIVGALPAMSLVMWKMYAAQIKKEKIDLEKYKQGRAALELQERQMLQAQMQAQAQQEAANSAVYEEEAANDEEYGAEGIPEKEKRAA